MSVRPPSRRGLLAASGALLVTACGAKSGAERSISGDVTRVAYGSDDQQYAELRRPSGRSKGTVVLIHGGYWQVGYGAELMVPLAEAWTALGHATWNIEYRRVGTGGGVPHTLEDVAAALDLLHARGLDHRVVVVGHSAGGQLAVWAASRTARTPGGAPRVHPALVVSLSGVLDLTLAAGSAYAGEPTTSFVGGTPARQGALYAEADPTLLVPAACPVAVVQAADDQVVASEQARSYVAHDTAAGGRARYIEVPGDHFSLIDPRASCFPSIRNMVTATAG